MPNKLDIYDPMKDYLGAMLVIMDRDSLVGLVELIKSELEKRDIQIAGIECEFNDSNSKWKWMYGGDCSLDSCRSCGSGIYSVAHSN